MKKWLLFFVLHTIAAIGHSQNDQLLKKELQRIDSSITAIEKKAGFKTTELTGASSREAYTATAFSDANTNELRKLAILFTRTGEEEMIYTANNKIIKIISPSGEYYKLNNIFYTKVLEKVENPSIIFSINDSDCILKVILKIL